MTFITEFKLPGFLFLSIRQRPDSLSAHLENEIDREQIGILEGQSVLVQMAGHTVVRLEEFL